MKYQQKPQGDIFSQNAINVHSLGEASLWCTINKKNIVLVVQGWSFFAPPPNKVNPTFAVAPQAKIFFSVLQQRQTTHNTQQTTTPTTTT